MILDPKTKKEAEEAQKKADANPNDKQAQQEAKEKQEFSSRRCQPQKWRCFLPVLYICSF